MTEPVHVLWTGGWDSSFRVLQLLLIEQRDVQPIYVIDRARRSTLAEMKAQDAILDRIAGRLERARCHRRQVYVRTDFAIVPELRERFDVLKSRTHIGIQYLWLASIADALGWSHVEMSIPKHELPSGLQEQIFHRLDTDAPTLRDSWEAELFSYWSFPVIGMTKVEMGEYADQHGFGDALRLRWFCYRPTPSGKACGVCYPCKIAQRDGATDNVRFRSQTGQLAHRLWTSGRYRLRLTK